MLARISALPRDAVSSASRHPAARKVIALHQGEENPEPEYPGDGDDPGEARAVFHVHEEESYEHRLKTAMASAATVLRSPKSTYASCQVRYVHAIRIAKIVQYTRVGRMCLDMHVPEVFRLELKPGPRHVVLDVLGVIFERLDAAKHTGEAYRRAEKDEQETSLANLRGSHGQRHGQAARDGHRGAGRTFRADLFLERTATVSM